MQKQTHNFTLGQVTEKLVLRSWWASFGVLPFANRLVVFVCNYTRLTPNQITAISSFFRVLSALSFLSGGRLALVAGALCYYLAYVVDCVDGPVARLKGMTSTFGRYFDHISDLLGDLLILGALAYGQNILFTPIVLAMLFMHIAESYISYLVNFSINLKVQLETAKIDRLRLNLRPLTWYLKYRHIFFSRNLKTFLSFPDYEAVTLLFFPLFGVPVLGVKIGFFVLIFTTLYTIFSSFVSLHTGDSRFP